MTGELTFATQIPRLLLVIECATALAIGKDESATSAKGALLFFLTHAYPKLRIAAAEALLAQLRDGDDVDARDILCKGETFLSFGPRSMMLTPLALAGAWANGPIAELQPLKQRLYDLLHVPRPPPPPVATAAAKKS